MSGWRQALAFRVFGCCGASLTFVLTLGFLLIATDPLWAQVRASGRITGGVSRLQSERGISGRFPSSRLTLDPEEYEGMFTLPNLGVLRVLPYYQFLTAYSDNIFLQKSDKNSDWVFVNAPGVIVDLEGKQHLLELLYSADIITNARFHDFNRTEHEFDARLTITPTRFLTLRSENDFVVRGIMPQYRGDSNKQFVANTVSVGAAYEFAKRSSIELTYQHDLVRFMDSIYRSSDYSADTIDLNLYYRILPKTRLFGEYSVAFVNNANILRPVPGVSFSTDNVRHQVSAGAAWDPTAKLRGRIEGGYEWVDYYDLPLSDGPFFEGQLEYDYSRRLRFGLRLLSTITESTPVTNTLVDGLNYQSTNFALRATYRILRNLDWHAEGFLIVDNYGYENERVTPIPQSDRKDTTVGFETGLDWRIMRNAVIGISYQFQNNDSKGTPLVPGQTFSVNDFRENLLTLYLSLVF